MDEITQSQKAGNGSNLIQAGTVTVNNTFVGITEQRAREIYYSEMAPMIRALAVEAQNVATKRMLDLFSDLMARVKKCEKDLSSFSDPGFLQNLRVAQESAAVSERKEDIETLSELLLARMKNGLKRTTKTSIRKSMEIVPELENEELTALTIVAFCNMYHINNSMASNVDRYLAHLDGYFSKILSTSSLPQGGRWLQHLGVLNCVEVNPFLPFKKLEDTYAEFLDGIVCVGIAKRSPEYIEAVRIMKEYGFGASILVPNYLLSEYVRLPIVGLNNFSMLPMIVTNTGGVYTIRPTEKQKEGLKKVIGLYKKDNVLLQKAKAMFAERMSRHGAIQQFCNWLASQQKSFNLTPIGETLAYVNARRCIPGLPIIDLG